MRRAAVCYVIVIAWTLAATNAVAEERSASWYADHPKERGAVGTLCKEYASQARSNPIAITRFKGTSSLVSERRGTDADGQTAQRDSGVSDLGYFA